MTTGGGATPTLEIRTISKTFPGVRRSTTSSSRPGGEVLALMGENGAGKSTLTKILSSAHQADPGGEILIDGQPVQIGGDPIAAKRHGIAIIYQELALAPNQSVAENIYLGQELSGRGGMIDRRSMYEGCRPVLERLGAPFGPETTVGTLSIAEQQLVEITRALHARSRILVLDEPTRGVDIGAESEIYRIIDELADRGIGVIVISSEMPEVIGTCDRVLVMCDRVLVMREGHVEGEVGGPGGRPVTQENITALAAGVATEAVAA